MCGIVPRIGVGAAILLRFLKPSERPVTQTDQTNPADYSSDLALVRAVLRKQESAVERFVARMRCVPLILESRNSRLGTPLIEDDLIDTVQDTLVVIWKKLSTYSGKSSLETWAFGFCRNQMLNAIRKRARRPLPMGIAGEAQGSLLERSYETEEEPDSFEVIGRGLDQLDTTHEQVIRLKCHSGLTFAQVGRRLDISPNTAKTYYYRGLKRLEGLLSPHFRAEERV